MDKEYYTRNQKTEVVKSFKNVIDDYCTKIDYLGVSSFFAPYEYYTVEALEKIYSLNQNSEIIVIAKKDLLGYYKNDYIFKIEVRKEIIDEVEKYLWYHNAYYADKTLMYYILKLAFIIAFYRRLRQRYNKEEAIIKNYEQIKEKEFNSYYYYRGQANYEYRISPSIIRNFNSNAYLDDNYYYKLLTEEGLEEKFNSFIKRKNINRYEKYAFLQHSCSFSPFVDFTENATIAASFALSNSSNINCFRNEDSAIFCVKHDGGELEEIEDKNKARSFLVNEFNLKIINSKYFQLGKEYKLKRYDGTEQSIIYYSISELIDDLTPKIKIIKIPTNDRMLYQKGLFICFYDCICLKDYIAYELNPNFSFVKVKIPKRNKRSVLNSIYKDKREFDPDHLMNPYLIFKE